MYLMLFLKNILASFCSWNRKWEFLEYLSNQRQKLCSDEVNVMACVLSDRDRGAEALSPWAHWASQQKIMWLQTPFWSSADQRPAHGSHRLVKYRVYEKWTELALKISRSSYERKEIETQTLINHKAHHDYLAFPGFWQHHRNIWTLQAFWPQNHSNTSDL